MATIQGFRDLIVYQKAYRLSLEVFEVSKDFPKEEKYALTDQIRRSSRSVAANIAEAWARKPYIKAFASKLIDSLGEEYETEVWLDFAKDHQYLSQETHQHLTTEYQEVRKILISMTTNPEKFFR